MYLCLASISSVSSLIKGIVCLTYRSPNQVSLTPIIARVSIVLILRAWMWILLIVTIGRSSALDVPSQISPSLLVAIVIGNFGIRKEVCSVGISVVSVRRRRGRRNRRQKSQLPSNSGGNESKAQHSSPCLWTQSSSNNKPKPQGKQNRSCATNEYTVYYGMVWYWYCSSLLVWSVVASVSTTTITQRFTLAFCALVLHRILF